jgi:hypothetical protein
VQNLGWGRTPVTGTGTESETGGARGLCRFNSSSTGRNRAQFSNSATNAASSSPHRNSQCRCSVRVKPIRMASYPFCNPIFVIPESFSFKSPQLSATKKSIRSMSNKTATYFTEFPPNWLDAPLDSPNDQGSYADIRQALHDCDRHVTVDLSPACIKQQIDPKNTSGFPITG